MDDDIPWRQAPLIALDLEGTGTQDREHAAILEIALVPLVNGRPDLDNAFHTLINPQRPIPRRPWISPDLTDTVLGNAPTLDVVGPEITRRLNGAVVVGHNVGGDLRLISRRLPNITPSGAVDTLRLLYQAGRGTGNRLTAALDRFDLTERVNHLCPAGRPHRALWDAVGTALLLGALTSDDTRLGNLRNAFR